MVIDQLLLKCGMEIYDIYKKESEGLINLQFFTRFGILYHLVFKPYIVKK